MKRKVTAMEEYLYIHAELAQLRDKPDCSPETEADLEAKMDQLWPLLNPIERGILNAVLGPRTK